MKADDYKVLIGCTVIQFLLAGSPRTASLLYVESLSRFDINRKEASFPFVLFYLVRHLSGPFVGYLEQIFGLKYVVVFGVIMASISVGGCFFAETILAVTILWAVMCGLGTGLSCHLIPSLLNQQFPKHRSKANGFAYSGVCFGLFVLSPIMEICIDLYGFSGSLLIFSAIMANSIPAALLLRNLNSDTSLDKKVNLKQSKNKETFEEIDLNFNPLNSVKILESTGHLVQNAEKCSVYRNMESDSRNCFEAEVEKCPKSSVIRNQILKKRNHSLRNFRVFIDPAYIIMLILHAGYLFVLIIVWTVILDTLRDKGVPQNLEIYYLLVLPISDLFGRSCSGYFIDKHNLSPSTMTSIANFMIALLLIAFVFFYNYIILMFCVALISIVQGAMIVLQVALIHESIETEKRTLAMTSRYMVYAPFCLLTSPMIGYFRGDSGSYDNVFYILSGVSLFCAAAACLIPQIVKRR